MPPTADVAAPALRILIVDDHHIFSELMELAMSTQPGLICVGTAPNAAKGVAMAAELQPDIVAMDIEMPGQDGLTATRRIREVAPDCVVVVVSAHCDPSWVAKAARAGAAAFIPKGGSFVELTAVLRGARHGAMHASPSALTRGPASPRADPVPALTSRQHDVLVCLSQGRSVTSIAEVLGITVQTCRSYITSLLVALGVHSRLEAVVKAQHLGLLQPADR